MLSKGVQGVIMRTFGSRDYLITVTGARDISPHYRRLSFEAHDLLAAHPPYPSMWIRVWCPGPDRLYQRAFTVVDPDPAAGTFDLEFAIHEQGYAMDLARSAVPGYQVEVSVLPRDDYVRPDPMPHGFVMLGDPASLPAINSILCTLPEDFPVRLWLGRQHPGDGNLPVALRPGVELSWVDHDDLVRAVRGGLTDVQGWFGWACVETAQTRELRNLLRTATGAGRRDGHFMGYWTRGHRLTPPPHFRRG